MGLQVKVATISSGLNFGRPAPPGSESAAGWNFFWLHLTYSQRAVFASLWALISLLLLLFYFLPSVSIPEGGLKIDENKLNKLIIIIIIMQQYKPASILKQFRRWKREHCNRLTWRRFTFSLVSPPPRSKVPNLHAVFPYTQGKGGDGQLKQKGVTTLPHQES